MSDNCFLCLNISRTRRCTQCKVKAHKSCWEEYTMVDETQRCPQCRATTKRKVYNTRLRENTIRVIRHFLTSIENRVGREQRCDVAKQLFEYLYQNIWFLDNNRLFRNIVKSKLVYLAIDENWEYAKTAHERFFGQTL